MAVKSVRMERAIMKDARREIDLLKFMVHKNIVRYFGSEIDKTHLYIFQEWVAGGSLTGLLSKFGPFAIAVVRSYLSQLLDGLIYLHENGIMHRDIKGSNILVSDEGVVKVADFGASKRLPSDSMLNHTMRGSK
jgi:serine/threonine protein kinase